ncbi:MAG: M28 family peptidase [Acidobacteria bacterium]|nr:M28 family peptidase [Acidobacteriota bacterium]
MFSAKSPFAFSCLILSLLGLMTSNLMSCGGSNPTAETSPPVSQPPVTDMEKPFKVEFDAERAFEHVRKQVEFGPRPAGSPAGKQTRDYLVEQLKKVGLKVTLDSFKTGTPLIRMPSVEMHNVIGELPGERDDVIILASHYDTKYFENFRFVGANDGASSTGVLLELARVLAALSPADRKIPQTLWFVFFDGEEAFASWSGTDHTYGSRHLVTKLKADGKLSKVKGLILLDMVGDKDLVIPREMQSSPWMADAIVVSAQQLGYGAHFSRATHYIDDDHLPFLQAGIPAIDLIDFEYGGPDNPYWHTEEDTLDKISPKSLKIVGDTVLHALPKIAAQAR